MFEKIGNATSVREIIERNVGMSPDEFLKPMHNPYIKNLKDAVIFFKDHAKEKVTIVGDYDSDGINATAIMKLGLKRYGVNAATRLPHRFSEGYGLSAKIIDEIDSGLVITVDNGIAAAKAIHKAVKKGLYVIVTDHHLAPEDEDGNRLPLPEANVLVDPAVEDESEFHGYCGAAIAYRFIQELLPGEDLSDLLVLASIATVSDVMKLQGANRTLVKAGLSAINAGKGTPGLRMMIEECGLEHIDEDNYGFKIGPIFNAAGRLYDNGAEKVLDVLTMPADEPKLIWYVKALMGANEKRKKLVADSMKVANVYITSERPIVIYDSSFGEGIIGIIAGHLCEEYNCPVIVFTRTDKGILKGSGRSTAEIHLKKALDRIRGTMLGYGGHEGAAGLSIEPERLEEFKTAFKKSVGRIKAKSDIVTYDLDVSLKDIKTVIEEIKKFAPYGEGNPKIRCRINYFVDSKDYRVIGDGSHFMINNEALTAMGFGLVEKYDKLGKPKELDCIGNFNESWFRGKSSYKFDIVDFQ
jgi:single-stranded-DNA-specific exonuclease